MPTKVQGGSNSNVTGLASLSVTLGSPVTGGNSVILAAYWSSNSVGFTSFADDKSNTYTLPSGANASFTDNAQNMQGACLFNVNNGPKTFTLNLASTGSGFTALWAFEYSGLLAVDGTGSGAEVDFLANGTDNVGPGLWTTTHANDMIFGASALFNNNGGGGNEVAGTGFTVIDTSFGFIIETKILSAAGSVQPTWSIANDNGTGANDTVQIGMAFQPGGGGGGGAASRNGLPFLGVGNSLGLGAAWWAARQIERNPIITRRGLLVRRNKC